MEISSKVFSRLLPSLRTGGATLRNVIAMMREDKLYSAMYICGTALAIAFTMLIAEVYYIKVADIAPEVNRSKTYILDDYHFQEEGTMGQFSQEDFQKLFKNMKTPDCVAAELVRWSMDKNRHNIKLPDGFREKEVDVRLVEPGFFRFFQFNFTEGAPFTQDDFENARPLAVITEEIREQLFGKEKKAIGQTIKVDNTELRICAVMETPSVLTEECASDIWIPYTVEGLYLGWSELSNIPVSILFCVPDAKHEAFMQELKEVQARFNSMKKDEYILDISKDITKYTTYVWFRISYMFGIWGDSIIGNLIPIILLLLLVPALNLSGMVASRMERRLPEMAIRKAFGAKRKTLLWQVIMENLTLTLIGGFFGLCLAWSALYGWRDWIFHTFSQSTTTYIHVPIISGEMLFGPIVFLIALLVCTILNVLAATLPAWLSLRKPIVESMMLRK